METTFKSPLEGFVKSSNTSVSGRMQSIVRALRKQVLWAIPGLAIASASMGMAQAQTLQRIEQTGTIKIGVLLENAPFGFIDTDGKPVGFNMDVAKAIVNRLGEDIKIEVVPSTNASRIANLVTGGTDLAVATLSMNKERANVIQFSKPYTVFENIIIGPKDKQIRSFDDIKDLRVSTGQASTAEADMLALAPKGTRLQSFADRAAALQALRADQVELMADDNMVLNLLEEIAPGQYEGKFAFSQQWVGVGMAKGQPELQAKVNAAIDEMRANGELEALHRKWKIREGNPEWPESIPGVPF